MKTLIIKAIQWLHVYLFTHSNDWKVRSKLLEADFERKLHDLALKDEHFMVRQTLASLRIDNKTQKALAKDTYDDVVRTLIYNEVLSPQVFEIIESLGKFKVDLDKRKEIDKIKYGRFSSFK